MVARDGAAPGGVRWLQRGPAGTGEQPYDGTNLMEARQEAMRTDMETEAMNEELSLWVHNR